MRKYLFLFLTIISFHAFSQNVTIRGYVQDSLFKTPIPNATVKLFRIKDAVFIKQTITNEKGFFQLDNLDRINIEKLIISVVRYNEKLFHFSNGTLSNVINCDTIFLSQKVFQLDAVEIPAFNKPIYYNHDTLTYLADSFNVKQNATVEDLLKKLPGIKVNNQGKITSQGTAITQLLVDGEDFFGKDVTIATRNLNASGVETVQLYEKNNETDFIKDGEKLKVINLKLKENAKKGTFGKVSGANDFKKFYEGTAFANQFRNTQKLAIFLSGGNIPNSKYGENDLYKSSINSINSNDEFGNNEDGNISNNELQKDGISKIFNTGAYYSNRLGKKSKIGFNYLYTNNLLKILKSERSQFILKDTNYTTNNEFNNFKKLENHNFDFKINHNLNSLTEIEIEPKFMLIKL